MWVDFWFTCNASFNLIFQFLKVPCSRDALLLKITTHPPQEGQSHRRFSLATHTVGVGWKHAK